MPYSPPRKHVHAGPEGVTGEGEGEGEREREGEGEREAPCRRQGGGIRWAKGGYD